MPFGNTCQDAFGNTPSFIDRGIRNRAIIALGKQDIQTPGLIPDPHKVILGASSDHIIFDNESENFTVGDEVNFKLNYCGLLEAMTSPFVYKKLI